MTLSYASNEHLVRTNIWSTQIKELFEAELSAIKYVDWITEFTDGDTINIPSLGQHEILDYQEGQAVKYTGLDTGNFTFSIDQYKTSATYITNRYKQDGFSPYISRLMAGFAPGQNRAIQVAMEARILQMGPDGQTAGNVNSINGADHRWIGAGASETLAPQDFAKALYALQMANVPTTNLVAIVHPSCEYAINTMTNLVNASFNPKWEGVISSGMSSGMRFIRNIYGFDVYTSQFIRPNTGSETIGARTSTTGVNNLFFSATADALPIVGAIRQAPTLETSYNKDLQREEYLTVTRYGFKLYRPENMVCVVTDTDAVI
jgi:hypothetical protein